MIAVVDYGMGNLGSIVNMFKKLGARAVITSDSEALSVAEKIILPGVGSFDQGIQNLRSSPAFPVLIERVLERKVPLLGICLGMQLLTKSSEEGNLPGLGWIEARTVKFSFAPLNYHLRVPHMGWNAVQFKSNAPIAANLGEQPRFYFVHSYYVVPEKEEVCCGTTQYEIEFASVIGKSNMIATQFHPEKSHKFGMGIFRNFLENY